MSKRKTWIKESDDFILIDRALINKRDIIGQKLWVFVYLSLNPDCSDIEVSEALKMPKRTVQVQRLDLQKAGLLPKDDPGFVYFIQSGLAGPIKIGKAKQVYSRLKILQIGSPTTLVLIAFKFYYNMGEEESRLHKFFEEYLIRGEWYKPEKELLKYIEELE